MTTPSIEDAPPLEDWPEAGVYQLWIRLTRDARITVGRLGRFVFPAGMYVYTGRASRVLRARVLRHARGGSKKHWHIDYLLGHRYARLFRVVLVSDNPDEECSASRAITSQRECIAPGFGASDCREGCASHLFLVGGLNRR